jgi:hypothetical protein
MLLLLLCLENYVLAETEYDLYSGRSYTWSKNRFRSIIKDNTIEPEDLTVRSVKMNQKILFRCTHHLQWRRHNSVGRQTKNVSLATRKIWGGSWRQRNENNWIGPIVTDKLIHGPARQTISAYLAEFSAPLSNKKWPAEKIWDIWYQNEFKQTQLLCLQEEWDYTKQSENSENWLTVVSLHSIARTSCYHEVYHFH